MDWSRIVDGYCERVGTDPNLWGEPLNAVTNIAFILAALWALTLARREGRLDWSIVALAVIVLAVGIGSFLFHTFATLWAGAMDVIPIQIFILVFFAVVLLRAFQLRGTGQLSQRLRLSPAPPVSAGWCREPCWTAPTPANAAALLLLIGNAAILGVRGHRLAGWLAAAAGLFTVSLLFRIIDQPVCGVFPYGTHFLWHLLNGTLMGLLLTGMVAKVHGSHKADAKPGQKWQNLARQPGVKPNEVSLSIGGVAWKTMDAKAQPSSD